MGSFETYKAIRHIGYRSYVAYLFCKSENSISGGKNANENFKIFAFFAKVFFLCKPYMLIEKSQKYNNFQRKNGNLKGNISKLKLLLEKKGMKNPQLQLLFTPKMCIVQSLYVVLFIFVSLWIKIKIIGFKLFWWK